MKKSFFLKLFIFLVLSLVWGFLITYVNVLFTFLNKELIITLAVIVPTILFIILVAFDVTLLKSRDPNKKLIKMFLVIWLLLAVGDVSSNSVFLKLRAEKSEVCEALGNLNGNYDDLNGCYIAKAEETFEENYCFSIRKRPRFCIGCAMTLRNTDVPHYRDMCFTNVAVLKGDSGLCKFTTDKEKCLSSF
jgi:hypothetical protein